MAKGDFATAAALAEDGAGLHPASPLFSELKSQALENSGAFAQAQAVAASCAAIPANDDWRAGVAVKLCGDRSPTELVGRVCHELGPVGRPSSGRGVRANWCQRRFANKSPALRLAIFDGRSL